LRCSARECKCGADTIFSTFTGSDAPLLLVQSARVLIRSSSFRDFDLSEEIFDVSKGSSVRLENCTFTNITVPDNEYVSTSYNDWDYFRGAAVEVTYYPEDDEAPLLDIKRYRANDSSISEKGMSLFCQGKDAQEHGIVSIVIHCKKQAETECLMSQEWTQGLKECRR
jgi:hypothetical protein